MSFTLPRQNIVVESFPNQNTRHYLDLKPIENQNSWNLVDLPVKKCIYIKTEPELVNKGRTKSKSYQSFDPCAAKDLVTCVRDSPPCSLRYETYDLGLIGLHRFEIDTNFSSE